MTDEEKQAPEESVQNDPLAGKPLSQAVRRNIYSLYDKVPLSIRQLDLIIWVAIALLAAVIVLIGLEAAGVYSIW